MFHSEHHLKIPCEDVLTWAFGNEDYNQDSPIWIDAYDHNNSISARKARTVVRKLIGGFRSRGLKPGDTVCVHSYNNIWYPVLYLAIIGTGGRFIGSNPAYKTFELTRLLTVSKTKYLISDPSLLPKIWTCTVEASVNPLNIFTFDTQDQLTSASTLLSSWRVLLNNEGESWHSIKEDVLVHQSTAALLLTSGTGGLPKAAVMSHGAIVSQAVLASYTAKRLSHPVRRLISLPFFHSFVLPFHLLALRHGQQTYVMPRFNAEDYASFIDRYHITTIPLVPPMALALFSPPFSNSYSYSSLHEVMCGGSPLGGDVQTQLVTKLQAHTRFYQLWGMTELGWVTFSRFPEQSTPGSSGRLLLNTSIRLVDARGNEISEEGRKGEILVKNSGTMDGYIGDPQATAECFVDGWFRTGDVGYCDKGEWYIVDRVKDLIKVRGWQVSPAEIEACLLTHPHVKDAAVIGISTMNGTSEVPCAYVVTRSSHSSNSNLEEELQSYVGQQLASYKALNGGVQFVQNIPRTVSGKILRRVLREQSKSNSW